MKFLAGLSKFISVFLMLAATAVCTAVIISEGIISGYTEAIWVMSAVWVCAMLVCLTILATGVALSQTVKLKKQVAQLEQRLWNQNYTQPVAPVPATPAEAPEAPAVDALANAKAYLFTMYKDLAGKTLYAPSTAKGANPEYILNYLLEQNGVAPPM